LEIGAGGVEVEATRSSESQGCFGFGPPFFASR